MTTSDLDFTGTARFTLLRRLGAGGTGVVYEAHDRERDETVALKTLLYADAAAIYRLKKEFRTLADVAHPNLVSLYELVADAGHWFFTMELVRGGSFLEYVRPSSAASPPTPADALQLEYATSAMLGRAGPPPVHHAPGGPLLPSPRSDLVDFDRVRGALRQLVAGVLALHAAGKAHRDLKPSNVLVGDGGRVVVLDFGIATEIAAPRGGQPTVETGLVGTLHYMPPEVDAGGVGAAGDFYALGVMLFEVLTGRLPYDGRGLQVLLQKQTFDPPRPDALVPGLPADLTELCVGLLERDPAKRLRGPDVLRQLGGLPPVTSTGPGSSLVEGPLVGRETQVAVLLDAFRTTRAGWAVAAAIHGPSGIGKSALVRHVVDRLQTAEGAVVLTGRCYDRESVPFKALDGVVDSLTNYLRTLPPETTESLLPRDVHALARLFPVLRRVDAVADLAPVGPTPPDPVTYRRHALAALRELLARIAGRHPLVIAIDDLQWADADSIAVLEELLRPSDAPAVLLLTGFRSEGGRVLPLLRTLLVPAADGKHRELALGPLADGEARRLAEALVADAPAAARPPVEAIVREARGSPFLVEQLVRYALATAGGGGAVAEASLADMLDTHLRQLPAGGHALLETLAVAGHPLDVALAQRAAGLDGDPRPLVAALRVAHLVRSSSGSSEQVELYHDQLRETLVARLGAGHVERVHLRIAEVLAASAAPDPETLFEHYLRGGQRERAAAQAARAAEKAAAALAFDRAAQLFRRALELGPGVIPDLGALRAQLGDALANAGRPGEAAEAFLAAAEEAADRGTARELRCRAGEQLLLGGHNDRGLRVMRHLLREVGLGIPSTPSRALLSLLLRRAQLRLRGLDFKERTASQLDRTEALRIDACAACAHGLALTDPVVSSHFGTLYLLLALQAGDPYRIVRALASEAGLIATRGGRALGRTHHVLERAQALAVRLGTARELGFVTMVGGMTAFLQGDWPRALTLCDDAERVLRERCTGVMWEITAAQKFALSALLFMGELAELTRRIPGYLADAQERGIPLAENEVRTRLNVRWLVADEPEEARRQATEALRNWSRRGFHRQHYNALLAFVQADLYLGDDAVAWRRMQEQWPVLRRSLLMRIQVLRAEATHLRARSALAAARHPGGAPLLRIADRCAQELARERMPWVDPFVPLIRAGIAGVRGDDARAVVLLGAAAETFDAANMRLYAAVSRRRIGEITGGDEGRRLVAAADAYMRAQTIVRPERFADVLAPGFGPAGITP